MEVAGDCGETSADGQRGEDSLFGTVQEGDDDNYGDKVVEHLDGEPPGDQITLILQGGKEFRG